MALCSVPVVLVRDAILTPIAKDGAQDDGAVIVLRDPLLTPAGNTVLEMIMEASKLVTQSWKQAEP